MHRSGEHERPPKDRERSRTSPAPPAPLTAADRVLALQGSAGNRAVRALLARDEAQAEPEDVPATAGARAVLTGVGPIDLVSFNFDALRLDKGQKRTGPTKGHCVSRSGAHSEKLHKLVLAGGTTDADISMAQGTRVTFKAAVVPDYAVSSDTGAMVETWTLVSDSVQIGTGATSGAAGRNRRPSESWSIGQQPEGVSMLRKLAGAAAAAAIAVGVVVVPAQAGSTKTVSVKNNAFSPTSLKIKKGTKVTWKWTQGGVPHNVTPTSGGKGSSTSSKKGFTYSKTFTKAGTYKFDCTIHPTQMKITVKVS